jgi:hypothetical protein
MGTNLRLVGLAGNCNGVAVEGGLVGAPVGVVDGCLFASIVTA